MRRTWQCPVCPATVSWPYDWAPRCPSCWNQNGAPLMVLAVSLGNLQDYE